MFQQESYKTPDFLQRFVLVCVSNIHIPMHGQDLEAERAWQMKSSDELPPLPPGPVGKGLDGYGHLKLETS